MTDPYWRYLFWLEFAAALFLIVGLIAVRRELSLKREGLIPLGRVFVPLALATFAAEHFTSADHIKDMIPSFVPWHLFVAYFVGVALLAAAVSIVTRIYVRLAATLLGVMLLLFVVMLSVPNLAAHPGDRFAWALVTRDTLFALGAWALAGRWVTACRVCIGAILLFFGVEHLLHPANLPGVPLEQMTLPWIPLRPFWGIAMGAMLLVCGAMILIDRHARAAAAWLGIATTIVVIILYLPLLIVARQPLEVTTAMNYIGDTLLFAGSIFLLAEALPAYSFESSRQFQPASA